MHQNLAPARGIHNACTHGAGRFSSTTLVAPDEHLGVLSETFRATAQKYLIAPIFALMGNNPIALHDSFDNGRKIGRGSVRGTTETRRPSVRPAHNHNYAVAHSER